MPIYTALNNVYDGNDYISMGISRADLIVLAATVAVRLTSLQQNCTELGLETNCLLPMPNITLKYGHKDCSTSPYTDVVSSFPNAQLGLSHVLEYFAQHVIQWLSLELTLLDKLVKTLASMAYGLFNPLHVLTMGSIVS